MPPKNEYIPNPPSDSIYAVSAMSPREQQELFESHGRDTLQYGSRDVIVDRTVLIDSDTNTTIPLAIAKAIGRMSAKLLDTVPKEDRLIAKRTGSFLELVGVVMPTEDTAGQWAVAHKEFAIPPTKKKSLDEITAELDSGSKILAVVSVDKASFLARAHHNRVLENAANSAAAYEEMFQQSTTLNNTSGHGAVLRPNRPRHPLY